jgi:nitric-oxide synthase, bacterial
MSEGCPFRHLAAVAEPTAPGAPDPHEARDFFEQYREQTRMPRDAWRARLHEVLGELDACGTYTHTADELAVGARLAWYHHTRCIGKVYWRSLEVRDRRHVVTAPEIRDECFEHLRVAANGGHVRPVITIFAPDAPGAPAARVRNAQLVAYAGHRSPDGEVVGDGGTVELTRLARACGWSPPAPPGPFDLLPLVVQEGGGALSAHPVGPELAHEVAIEHPTLRGLAGLGLRWYGFPTVSDMALTIGGIVYPLAPFTGWYVAPELSARDFTDPHRYDLLEPIARALGLDTGDRRGLWKDRAMVELTAAVLWSYERAGVRMDDHHEATRRFHRWTQAERRRGREVQAEWTWMVPPLSASATPVFHERYEATRRRPDFLRLPVAEAGAARRAA